MTGFLSGQYSDSQRREERILICLNKFLMSVQVDYTFSTDKQIFVMY